MALKPPHRAVGVRRDMRRMMKVRNFIDEDVIGFLGVDAGLGAGMR